MAKVAFLGLGVMGFPMAGHLQAAGHAVTVYNRTTAKASAWVAAHGGTMAPTPREAAAGAEVVFACVGADPDLREVCLGGDGALAGMAEGSVFVDHTTASAEVARELHGTFGERGVGFVDAPVSGGQSGAEQGVLTVMAGGDPGPYAIAEPLIRTYAKQVRLLGPSGSGQLTKMVNQICAAGIIESLAEGVAFAQAAGLDIPAVMSVITHGASASWQMSNRWETMLQGAYDHGFAVDWYRKDLGMCLDEASRLGVELPVAHLVDGFYEDVQAMGGQRWDTSSLLLRLRDDVEGA